MFISYLNSDNSESDKKPRNRMKIKNVASIPKPRTITLNEAIGVNGECRQNEQCLTMDDLLKEVHSIVVVSNDNNENQNEKESAQVVAVESSEEENVDAFDDDAYKYADYSEELQYQHALVVNTALTLPWQLADEGVSAAQSNNNSTDDSDTQLRTQPVRRVRRTSVCMKRRDAFRQRKLDTSSTWRHLR